MTAKHFKVAQDLREGDVLSNGRRLVEVFAGPYFVRVSWRSPSAKTGLRSTRFARDRNVLVRDKQDTPTI